MSIYYQFYDPLMKIVEEFIQIEKKNFLMQRNKLNIKMANSQKNMLEKVYDIILNDKMMGEADDDE